MDAKEKRRFATGNIRRYLARYRKGLIAGAASLAVTDMLLLINPWILKTTIDELETGVTRDRLVFLAALFVGVTMVSGVFRFLMRRIMIGISRRIELDMRADFFAHLQTLSASFYNRTRTGDLMALATNDLNAVRMLVGPGIMYSLNTLVMSTFAVALMLVLSPKLTVAVLLPMVVLTVVVYHSMKVIHRLFERVQARFATINSRAQENLSGIRVVKAYTRENHEIEEFENLSETYVDENMKLFRVQSLMMPLLTTVAGLGGLVLLAYGGRLVISESISLGTFVAFSGYLTMLIWPMIALGWVMNILQRGLASMERISDVMRVQTDIADDSALVASGAARDGSVRFENVSFAYEGGRDSVLRGIDFSVRDRETVALVGATGSGKTTLISLILRLYDPSEGRVLVGGRSVNEVPLAELRSMIGLVPQDIFLFSDTIRENIGFGVTGIDDATLDTVSETASIREEVLGFPNGFESRIGERGINLSGGQKQRVAIARALAKRPRILIFDDALSSVDTNTEEKILQSLRAEVEGRTAIIISHRVSTAMEADRIVVLDDGRIAEQGTHEELVARDGIYAEMHRKQMIVADLERQ